MSREKKVKIFMVVVVVLYLLATGYGLGRDDGKMGEAMAKVNAEVASAREAIREEMEKPFILRIFGSLFSMEGNSLEKLKVELPKVLKEAMPSFLRSRASEQPASPITCVGMRLADALLDLQSKEMVLDEVLWSFDETVQERYLQLGGTVLDASLGDGGVRLVVQFPHPWNGQEGLGASERDREEHLRQARVLSLEARDQRLELYDWLVDEDREKIRRLVGEGFDLARWCDAVVPFDDPVSIPRPGPAP